MFTIEDYCTTNTSTKVTVAVGIDSNKIQHDIEELRQTLSNLQELIGPYTIKVRPDKIKFKIKKKK